MLGEGGKVKRVKEGRGLDNRHIITVIHGTLKIEKHLLLLCVRPK